jgi:hypothetical protein
MKNPPSPLVNPATQNGCRVDNEIIGLGTASNSGKASTNL